MALLLGIDVGTSATKTLLCNERGEVLATASAPHTLLHPHPGWSEQNPAEWWTACVHAIRDVLAAAKVSGDVVGGIGLSGQMHGSVFLGDEAMNGDGSKAAALRPALLWNDQRTARECAEIEAAVGGRAALVKLVGNAALTGFTAPKILWVRRHEPDLFRRVKKVCLPKDYIVLRLTGQLATDVGDASGTLLFDVARRRWSEEASRLIGIDSALFPPPHESAAVVGQVTNWAASQTGLKAGTPVVAGSGDNMTSAVGSGVVERGIVAAALGTSGVIIAHADQPAMDLSETGEVGRTHTMCAASGAWCITGCMLSAGGSLKWCRDSLFPGVSYDELMAEAAKAPSGSGGLVFLPYLTGERCPHPDPQARGGWIGLTARHTRAHLVRAIIEGVSFSMGEILDIVRGMGIEAKSVRISGGGANSALWRQIQADVYGCPVVVTNSTEGPAHGAAILAGVGTKVWGSVAEACRGVVKEVGVTPPRARGADEYSAVRRVYSTLYGDLKERFGELAAIDR